MANPIESAAIALNFCYTHLNYPGARQLAEAIREQYFTDEVFRSFPGVHPEILERFNGYRTRNGRPILQFYVTDLISDGLVGIYLLGVNRRHNEVGGPVGPSNSTSYIHELGRTSNSSHSAGYAREVRVLGFKNDGTRITLPASFRSKLTNLGTELHEAQISSVTEDEFWNTSEEMGIPMFNVNQGQIVLLDRHDAPRFTVQKLDSMMPWYNVITRQQLDPSHTRAEPFDWLESDLYYHTYFAGYAGERDFSRMSPTEIAAALWENGEVVTPPINTGTVREGLGYVLGPFNVEDIWNASSLKPLINDLDIPKIQ